ncbi:MAG: S8 family peptidase, partial [Thermoplasmata archaeon]
MASELMRRFKSEERRVFSTAFDGFSASVSLEDLNEWFSIGSDGVQVYPDIRMRAMLSESVYQIGADQVWSMHDLSGNSVRGTGIVVAVIDTGVDYRHPDLGGGIGPGYKVIGGYDFYNGDSDPMDDHGHGTHVAGIIAANGGITGVAPDASILAYKVLGMDGSGLMSDVIAAIEAAMDPNGDGDTRDHADIISMSLGGAGSEDDPVCLAVEAAVEAGIVVVVAAGNSGPGMGTVASPGVAPYAITVGAVDGEWRLAPFSSRGTGVDLKIKPEISAPGVDIVSTVPFSGTQLSSPTGYMALSGTSMATPHVSGVAALLVQMNPTWSPEQVKSAIVTEALDIDESLWHAGAGGLWAPGSIAADLFSGEPVVSYGFSTSPPHNVSVTNTGVVSSFALGSLDWLSLYSNGSSADSYWANLTDVSPSSMRLALGGSGEFSLSISLPEANVPEGYYEGFVVLSDGSRSLRVAFGYAVLSQVNVHVVDLSGREVFDPYGGVWIYSLPTATASFGRRAENSYAPPASFLIPSGEYSVHAAGHQLIYHYSDPYLLSKTFTLERHQMLDIYLQMSEARVMSLNLTAENGLPIYVKDYRVYARYAGDVNVSFDLVGSDYAITSKDFSTLKKSCNVFVSDTMATVGISIAGFSFTSDMWDFVARNQDHWYEHPGSSFTGFSISAIADVQYLLAWEFDGVNGITSLALELDSTRASRYVTKYDVPGVIGNVWGDWGRSLAMGGQAAFFIRRNTQTSLNPFYAGTTRTIIVQGVFSELYYPGNLFEGTYTQHLYDPDYSHRVGVDGMPGIFLPDRYSLRPIEGGYFVQRVGVGPFYPSVKTQNSNDTLVLFHPLLRDQAGLEVSGAYVPYMNLYLNGHLKGIYQLSEFTARRNAIRYTNLEGVGFYTAEISYQPTPDICNDVKIVLGFAVPSEDCDPPQIAGLEMPQCFVPGSTVPIGVRAFDS